MKDTVIIKEKYVEKIFSTKRLPISRKIEKAHIILSSLNLKYIQVPKKLYYNNSNFYIKYSAPFFKDSKKKYNRFLLIEIRSLLQNLIEIDKEIDIITKNNIMMRDIHSKNITFDGRIRIIDPGSYTYESDKTMDKIKIFNNEKLRTLVISIIYEALKCKNINEQEISYIIMQLNSETRKYSSIINFLENIDNKEQTLENYILKKLKIK